MNGSLLDTNILSELGRPSLDPCVTSFVLSHPVATLFISTVNIAELRFGIQLASSHRRLELERWLAIEIRSKFIGRVLSIDEEVLLRWRFLLRDGAKSGRTYPQPDLFLAAIALEHDLTLVTRNVCDFAGTGVRVFNPWDAQP